MIIICYSQGDNSTQVVVTIEGSPCLIPADYVVTDTEIVCVTGDHEQSVKTHVRVSVGEIGIATMVCLSMDNP